MLACLYDVHGNLPALEAVLDDAGAQGADRFLLGGDYALFGGWPAETVARLRTLSPAVWIRGNVDRWTADPSEIPVGDDIHEAIAFCRAQLGDELVQDLGSLAEQIERDGTLFVHASPVSDVRSFTPEPSDDEDELLADVTVSRLVFGHTHLQFRRSAARPGVEFLNPGSVGVPCDGDQRAAYALIDDDRRIELRRVEYDFEASAARVREAAGDAEWGEVISQRILRARAES